MKQRKMIVVIGMVAVILMVALTGCGSKVDALQYLSISYTGYNGNGTARVDLDEDALIETIIGSEPEDLEGLGEWILAYDKYVVSLDVVCDPEEGLSNGDTVTVIVTVSGAAAEEIAGGEKQFQVTGLPEVQTVDVFANVMLDYEGIIGDYTYAKLNVLSEDAMIKACRFAVEPQSAFQNGDEVTVSITNAEELAEKYLCIPAEMSKTFTVSGLDAYLTDGDLLPEDQIREIIDQYIPASQKEDNFIFTYSESVYYKTYFCVGDKGFIGADINRLMVYACCDEYMDGKYRETVYTPLIFRDLIIKADGTIDLEYADGYTAVFSTDPDVLVESLEKEYTVEEVYIEY